MLQMLPDMPMAAKFFVAFVIVLALIGLTAWLVRRFGANRLSGNSRGRQPRLAVIDAASVDSRRRLVLIRRDNVEHLMMIGGPNDMVIEPNIVRAAARDAARDTLRAAPADALPRAVPNGEAAGNWPLQPAVEPPAPAPVSAPTQMPPPRSYRPPVTDEPWTPPEPPAREPNLRARPADSLTGMAAEFKLSPDADLPPPPRPAPQMAQPRETMAPPPPPPAAPAQTDHNLAEMAQRLEAALRRPSANDIHPPVTDPLAASVPPPSRPAPPAREIRPEPKAEFKPEPKLEPKSEPKMESKPAQAKSPFDSLEEEMASLLGRQPGKT